MANELVVSPIVNLQGSAPDVLLAQYDDAFKKLGAALEAVQMTLPHARDYPTDPTRYKEAYAQHRARVERLIRLQFELEVLATSVRLQRLKKDINLFEFDDPSFLTFIASNPTDYVLNVSRSSDFVRMHRADCRHLTAQHNHASEHPYTGNEYLKVCADSVTALRAWARRNRPDSPFRVCTFCIAK